MKAIVINKFGGYDKLDVSNVEKPEVKSGQFLIRMKYAAVNYIDTLIRSGDANLPKQLLPALPHIPSAEGGWYD